MEKFSYGDACARVTGRIENKTGLNKSGHTVIVSNITGSDPRHTCIVTSYMRKPQAGPSWGILK